MASTLKRPDEVAVLGTVTDSVPSLGVLASTVVGNVSPPSVEYVIFTFATLNGELLVLAVFQLTVIGVLPVTELADACEVTANGVEPATVIATSPGLAPPPPGERSRAVRRKFIVRAFSGRNSEKQSSCGLPEPAQLPVSALELSAAICGMSG